MNGIKLSWWWEHMVRSPDLVWWGLQAMIRPWHLLRSQHHLLPIQPQSPFGLSAPTYKPIFCSIAGVILKCEHDQATRQTSQWLPTASKMKSKHSFCHGSSCDLALSDLPLINAGHSLPCSLHSWHTGSFQCLCKSNPVFLSLRT